jgi:tRNA threonylcarbamoyladenosine biosynthesis protein TsaB
MNVLAIDTSTALLGIGLKIEQDYFEINQDIGLHHTENLLVEVDSLLRKARTTCRELDLVVVSKGPGSFTGLRIGMATAKGIAFGASLPIISVPGLDVSAYGKSCYRGVVCPVIDARKQRIYTAFYRNGVRQSDYLDISPEEMLVLCREHETVLLTGPFAGKLFEEWKRTETVFELDPQYGHPQTWELLHYGIELYPTRGADSPAEGPLYIRPSEAEMSLKDPGR